MVGLVAAVAALLLLPHPVVADDRPEGSGWRGPGNPEGVSRWIGQLFQGGAPVSRDELTRTRERLGEVETVLRDARADAGAVAQALAAADRAVARSRVRLATATAELDRARQRRPRPWPPWRRPPTRRTDRRGGWPSRSAGPT
jgi:hypothetical protein